MRKKLLIALIVSAGFCSSEAQNDSLPAYDKIVESFECHNVPAIQAILSLGLRSTTPLGLVLADDELCRTKIDIVAREQTPLQIIETLTNRVSGYHLLVKDGVVIISPKHSPENTLSLLNIVIPRYAAPESTLDTQRAQLWRQIHGVLEPAEGTAMVVPFSLNARTFPAIDIRNATVEELLDRIVARNPTGAWILYPMAKQDIRNFDIRYLGAFSYAEDAVQIRQVSCESSVQPVPNTPEKSRR